MYDCHNPLPTPPPYTQVPKKIIPYGVTSVTYTRMIDDTTFNLLVGSGEGKVMNYNVSLTPGKGNKVTVTCKYAKDTHIWGDEKEKSAVTSIGESISDVRNLNLPFSFFLFFYLFYI